MHRLILPEDGTRKRKVRMVGAHRSVVVGGDDAEVKGQEKPQLQSVIVGADVEKKKEEKLVRHRLLRRPLVALFAKKNLSGKAAEVAIGECIRVADVEDGEPAAKRYKR